MFDRDAYSSMTPDPTSNVFSVCPLSVGLMRLIAVRYVCPLMLNDEQFLFPIVYKTCICVPE
jgi:hypothetical protein